jgi:hypothetical protein
VIDLHPTLNVLIVSTKVSVSVLSRLLTGYQIYALPELLEDDTPWAAFRSHNVLLWPDGGDTNRRNMDRIGAKLHAHQVSIKIVDTSGLGVGWSPAACVQIQNWGGPELLEIAKAKCVNWREMEEDENVEVDDTVAAIVPPPEYSASVEPKTGELLPKEANGHSHEVEPTAKSIFITWTDLKLTRNGREQPLTNIDNMVRILTDHPKRAVRPIWTDTFLNRIMTIGDDGKPEAWSDAHDLRMTLWVQRKLGMAKMCSGTVHEGVVAFASKNTKDCLCDYLHHLAWDQTDRLRSFLSDAFGTKNDVYHQAAGKAWLISMVARALDPGCQVDTMPVLEGEQGINKTSALRILGGEWYAEITDQIGTKDFFQSIQGKWLCEIGELSAFEGVGIEKINQTITTRIDHYRASYGHYAIDFPRRCVFAATTNRFDWSADDTGARRFLPIRCLEINLDYLRHNRIQLFAEAVHRFKAGEPWWDFPVKETRLQQMERYQGDVWTDDVIAYAERYKWRPVTIPEVLAEALSIPKDRWDRKASRRIGAILRRSGWIAKTERVNGGMPTTVYRYDTYTAERVRELQLLAEQPKPAPEADRAPD